MLYLLIGPPEVFHLVGEHGQVPWPGRSSAKPHGSASEADPCLKRHQCEGAWWQEHAKARIPWSVEDRNNRTKELLPVSMEGVLPLCPAYENTLHSTWVFQGSTHWRLEA